MTPRNGKDFVLEPLSDQQSVHLVLVYSLRDIKEEEFDLTKEG